MECLGAIQWDQPAIVGPVAAALTAGVFAIVIAIMKRKEPSNDGAGGVSTTVSPEITVAPQIDIENKPMSVFKPTVKVGLDEKDVGQEVSKAVDPLRQGIEALRDQLATAQLAPKQPVPDSEDPLNVKAVEFYNAAVDAYNEGEIGQATGHWLDAVELLPDFAAAHYNLGLALKAKGELDAAIEHWSEALRIDPDLARAHNNLGLALYDKGKIDEAIEHYNAALRIDPDHVNAHYNLGNARMAKGELDAAIEHYNAALRIDPDDAAVHNNLGVALKAKGELDAAIEHYHAAIRINPKSAPYHDNLARALAQKRAAAAAVAALAKAIELDPRFRAWAKTHTDYDPIRADPAFRKLVYGE
ncbi:MAG: tetratricopeptide repeat protein [Verrucomicrobiota bacterium]